MFLDRPRSMFDAIRLLGHEMDYEPLLIPAPTEARPGSEEKVRVLQARLEAGEDLYHPDDACIVASLESQNLMATWVKRCAVIQREENRRSNKYPKAFAYQEELRKKRGNRIRKKGCRS